MTIIEKINQVVISNGVNAVNKRPWTRYEFQCESGKKYSTFESVIGTKFKSGDQVAIEGEQAGQYFNMTEMKIWNGSVTEDIPVEKPGWEKKLENTMNTIISEQGEPVMTIQASIQRQCALKAAVEFSKDNKECTGEEVLFIADTFVKWINGN